MKDLTTHFFPLKGIQSQKCFLRRGLFNPWDSNIHKINLPCKKYCLVFLSLPSIWEVPGITQ